MLNVGLGLTALALLVLGAATAGFLPLLRLARPTGPFSVGTVMRTIDTATLAGPAADGGRTRIDLELWYPALDVSGARRAPYRFADTPDTSLATRLLHKLVRTDAFLDAPVATGRHPVLLYVPSWGGERAQNTSLAQSLASHGFIVVAMDDLYPARPMDLSSGEAYRESLQWAAQKARLQAASAQKVLDALAAWDTDDPTRRFTSHLDLEHVGAFGFSFGGATAAELARIDPRVRAAVNMDGWLFGDAADLGVPKPFLILSGTEVSPGPDDASRLTPSQYYSASLDRADEKRVIAGLRRYGGYLLTIEDAGHTDFCDAALLPSIRHTGFGAIDGRRAARIIERYVTAFFESSLRGNGAPQFEVGTPDTAARLDVWPVPPSAR